MVTKQPGGVCAAKGFSANGIHCGIRRNRSKRDISLIVSAQECVAAGVYTRNKVKGAPLLVTREHIADGKARAIICNSGNANTCNANGVEIAQKMCQAVGRELAVDPADVVVASTGVIGQPLALEPILNGLPELVGGLSADHEGSVRACEGIMTTDTRRKEIAFSFQAGGVECHIGGIGKGSGMIHPNMATMLVFITTDVAIAQPLLQKALSEDILDTFNMVSVDGDTSTNDMVVILANGMAGNPPIEAEGEDYREFCQALRAVTRYLCRMIAKDGEGATKLLQCRVTGAPDVAAARIVAKSVITSSLFKAAMFGEDANWGRVLCAIGYAEAEFDIGKVAVTLSSDAGVLPVCKQGAGIPFSEELAKQVLSEEEIDIHIDLGQGDGLATAWGCDLTYDYVKINGDYRT